MDIYTLPIFEARNLKWESWRWTSLSGKLNFPWDSRAQSSLRLVIVLCLLVSTHRSLFPWPQFFFVLVGWISFCLPLPRTCVIFRVSLIILDKFPSQDSSYVFSHGWQYLYFQVLGPWQYLWGPLFELSIMSWFNFGGFLYITAFTVLWGGGTRVQLPYFYI